MQILHALDVLGKCENCDNNSSREISFKRTGMKILLCDYCYWWLTESGHLVGGGSKAPSSN